MQLDYVDHGADRPDRPADDSQTDSQAQAPASPSREALQQAIIGKAVDLLSGPGGPTSLKGCVLLCSYHHQVVIHRWGWTLVLNPDGTTTAWNPDRTKVLHSHGPPARPG